MTSSLHISSVMLRFVNGSASWVQGSKSGGGGGREGVHRQTPNMSLTLDRSNASAKTYLFMVML